MVGKWVLVLVFGLCSFGSGARASLAIISTDDRHEWFQETSKALRDLGRSTAALLSRKQNVLEPTGCGFRFTSSVVTHATYDKLCPGVRFREQLAPSSCSGFLVAPDLLVTAEHCLESGLDSGCRDLQVLFDFLVRRDGNVKSQFRHDQVFSCREVVSHNTDEDWALIRLDRPTSGRKPFKLRDGGKPSIGSPVVMLGYPRGVPLKYSANAKVVEPQTADPEIYFEADLDGFGGNSGSAVVNAQTLELEGLMVVGFGEFEDPETDPATGTACYRLRTYPNPDDATPVWVTRATHLAPELKKTLDQPARSSKQPNTSKAGT